MGLTSFIWIFCMAFGAAFVQRVTGFGFGIFIMTVLPYLLPSYGEATTLSGMLSIMTAVPMLGYIWRHVDWRKLLPILITFLIVSWGAVRIVSLAGDGLLKRILGAVLILAAAWFYFFSDKVRLRPTMSVQIGMGSISGMMGGLFGMQGPPAVLYFLATAKDKNEYMFYPFASYKLTDVVSVACEGGIKTYEESNKDTTYSVTPSVVFNVGKANFRVFFNYDKDKKASMGSTMKVTF